MKTKYVLLLLLLIAAPLIADEYWLSLGADNDVDHPNYLMKIDETGKVLVPPTVVVPRSMVADFDSGELPTALGQGSKGRLILWIGNDDRQVVYRALIDKKTLKLLSLTKVLTGYDFNFLQSNQAASPFLFYEKKSGITSGAYTEGNGKVIGALNPNPRTNGNVDKGSVSADGTMVVVDDDNNIYMNPLNPQTGRAGDPRTVVFSDTNDVDITNILPNGRRFVVYYESSDSVYYLQVINGLTGQRVGSPILLSSREPSEEDQEIAIDPLGRFVVVGLYADDLGVCGLSNGIPAFIKLNQNTGDPVGAPKPLTDCSIISPFLDADTFGMDIMREP
jgi:hypothetical protein